MNEVTTPATEIAEPDWKEKALRAMAELENYRKRMTKEMLQARDQVEADVIQRFLDLADDMRRMIDSFRTAEGPDVHHQMLEGAKLVQARFMNILEGLETTGFDSKGQQFAAELMEAIATAPSKQLPAGTVVEELSQGFKRRGKVLRAARVVVATLPPGEPES